MMNNAVAFGPFVFSHESETLSLDGVPVSLGHRAARLLARLLAERGEVVSKASLLDAAWPGIAVEESNLTVQMACLRKTVGVTASGRSWIVTVPRVGYRFLSDGDGRDRMPTTNSDGPSIAVLPFTNIGNEPEQDYFARGLAEDLVTDLSKVNGLTVIASNSSFSYRAASDTGIVATELGVTYLVKGSVRRGTNRLRINAQLIAAIDNRNVWAERFDGDLADVFRLQDEIVAQIVSALSGQLSPPDHQRGRRPVNLEAYELLARGRALLLNSPDGFTVGRQLLEQAAELDPDYPDIHAWLAMGHLHGWYLWGIAEEGPRLSAMAAARRAIALDPESALGHAILGHVQIYDRQFEEGAESLATALRIDPNNADATMHQAEMKTQLGDHAAALAGVQRAFALNPHPPAWYYWVRGFVEYASGDYLAAIETLSHEVTRRTGSQRILAAALAQTGRLEEARKQAAQFMSTAPQFSIASWRENQPMRSEAGMQHFVEGYLKAGLPM